MKIAQITSTYLSVPPRSHGGTELVVYHLVEGLVARGHEVVLFASGDSQVSAQLNSVVDVASTYDPESTTYLDKELETRNTYNLYRQGDCFDIIHGHWPTLAPYFSDSTKTPTVLTYAYIERQLHEYYRTNFPRVQPVCIGRHQAAMLGEEDLPVIYNGIDLDQVPFNAVPEDFLVTVGRIVPSKGIAEAIRIAKIAGERLIIVGDVTPYLPWSQPYFEEQVAPHIDGDQIQRLPHLSNGEVMSLVGRAKAFLFPLQWDEPFGLAVAESMATGTPVVTYPRGAMPELIGPGTSGFLVHTEEQAVQAIRDVGAIDRMGCRQWVEEFFGVGRMVSSYEALYERVLASGGH
ncbi:glycosyltransferase family 4 protein [Dehalococcoidia bacterium]|nr:glycosyltransferase family 4 protein [Dehalococcoidia bacterium]